MGTEGGAQAEAEAVARRSYGKLVAFLAARTRDVAGAEDALSEAFATALTEWPVRGLPDNPEAWLITVARRKTVDAARRRHTGARAAGHLRLIAEELAAVEPAPLHDDRLALMFACAHPAIETAIRAPLILHSILGLDEATIASAFLIAPSAMAQRLVRAKTRIRHTGIPLRVPDGAELPTRLQSVLDAVYAAFSEGWTDPAGTDASRGNLAEDGVWLGRLIVAMLPGEPEALGLLSLMLHAEARRFARRDAGGEYVPLAEQQPARWNGALIDEAEALLHRAATMDCLGRYQLEAAIQSAHVVRRRTAQPDWSAIVSLYDALAGLTDSPVVAINRAVAIAEIAGPQAGLAALDGVATDRRLAEYQPYWAARAALLARGERRDAAGEAYLRAIGLERDPSVRRFLQRRRGELGLD
jgi:RNA polymerase sigma-70 factor (ECF subfamily)